MAKPTHQCRKKGASTQAQRKALSVAGILALDVRPTEVVYAGCKHTIKLDQRLIYYPGLREKHHELCESVQKCRANLGQEQQEMGSRFLLVRQPTLGARYPIRA
ncbi:hypothetical protein B0H13DRAFT_1882933 [Mycena leptocephala]|nr:hypothetical protein B0H13DRAFT_1882933 [Mycena leptocephala]